MTKLFGTDGIRGTANQFPITAEMALRIGRSAAYFFSRKKNGESVKIIIGKDTRISGTMLEYALAAGVCSMGADALLTGVLPTPGVAYITKNSDADAGIVISASHNPYFDNGIKIFNGDGFKLSDFAENQIEQLILDHQIVQTAGPLPDVGGISHLKDSVRNYADFLKSIATLSNISFHGLKIAIDCANGAVFQTAPLVFAELGGNVINLFAEPDGLNINRECGSQHPESLAKKVIEHGADIGLAFDGDGDRLIAVDENGNIVSGDRLLAVCAAYSKEQGRLRNNILVSTVMSNIGLGLSLKRVGIEHRKSDVGDRFVMEKMMEYDAVLGGEDSGHLIFMDHHTTGDGILAALKLIEVMIQKSQPLSQLVKIMDCFPQELINVVVNQKPDLTTIPEIVGIIRSVETELGDRGRVLVRYSGTQPLCRVMVEGPTVSETQKHCSRIAAVVKDILG